MRAPLAILAALILVHAVVLFPAEIANTAAGLMYGFAVALPFVPMSRVGYVVGAARVPLWRYTWTTVVGILPITAAATYLGQALDDSSLSDPFVWLATGVLVVLVATTLVGTRHLGRRTSPKG